MNSKMLNGTGNSNNGNNTIINGIPNTVTGSNGGGGISTTRTNNNDLDDNCHSRNNERRRSKNKLSPPNLNTNSNNNNSNNIINNGNSQLNVKSQQTLYSKNLDDWISNNNNNLINPNGGYQQRSLDDWLNATMKDSPNTFSVSSTEFLDGPRNSAGISGTGMHSVSAAMANQFRIMPEITNPFPFVNTYETSQYFQRPPFTNTSATLPMPNHNSDFTSLPPGVNLNQESNRSNSQNDLLDGLETRRFSDPCLAGNSDDEGAQSGQRGKINSKAEAANNKLLSTLIQQINVLHDTNSKICRNLNDTKIDIEALKHAPSWGLRHRRDSISGSTHSQPMGYPFGTHSPAPTYHSGMYTPGMMTDVVREVKEAARIREEALLSRVRAMVEERSWSMNESQLKTMRDLEEMKIQINQLKADKYETKTHITKLEEEIKSLRTIITHALNVVRTNSVQPSPSNPIDRPYMRQNSNTAAMRTSPHDRQKRHSLCLNYGTINQDDSYINASGLIYPNENDIVQPMQEQFNELLKGEKLKYLNGGADNNMDDAHQHNGIYDSTENNMNDGTIVQMEKDNLELRRELQDALANKKYADQKIQTLENLVKNLQTKSHPNSVSDNSNVVTITTAHSSTRMNNANKMETPSAKPQIATPIQTISPKVMTTNNGTSTINLSGPVTDL